MDELQIEELEDIEIVEIERTDIVPEIYNKLTVFNGMVYFPEIEKIKLQAKSAAKYIENIVVNEENLKDSKKILATVNNHIKILNDVRIKVKNKLLEPHDLLKEQIDEISKIVKDADEKVRNQIKEIEEAEREQKKNDIMVIWNRRIEHYDIKKIVVFDDFYKESMGNKTTTMKKVEEEMVNWLEQRKADYDLIMSMPNSAEILEEYLESFNVSLSMNIVNARREKQKELDKIVNSDKSANKSYIFIVEDEKDAKLLEMLMKENKIKYNMEVK